MSKNKISRSNNTLANKLNDNHIGDIEIINCNDDDIKKSKKLIYIDNPDNDVKNEKIDDCLVVEIKDNEHYYIPGGITIKNVTFDTQSRGSDYMIMTAGVGDTVTFENCTVERQNTGMTVIGAEAGGPNMVFNECEFKGPVAPNFVDQEDRTSQFNNCTFGVGTARIVMGFVNAMGGTHTFTGCSFDYTGGSTSGSNQYVRWNAVNSYSETDNSYSTTVILDGCTFTNCGTQRYGSNSTLTVK